MSESKKSTQRASRARVPWQVRAESVEPRRKALGHRLKKEGGSRDLGGRGGARLQGATCGRGRRRWRPAVHPNAERAGGRG